MKRLIVLGGCQRSGTTLIRNILAGNPMVGAVDTERGLIFHHYSRLTNLAGLPEPKLRSDMLPAIERMLKDQYIAKWGLDAKEVLKSSRAFKPGWEGIFLSFVEAYGRIHDVPVVLLKRPWAEEQFPYFRALSKRAGHDIRLIYTVRNPLDVYRSWKHWGYRTGCSIAESTPAKWCGKWLKSTLRLVEFSYRFPAAVKVVRYEDTVAEPQRIAEELCRHLSLPVAATEMIGFDRNDAVNSSFDRSDLTASAGGVVNVVNSITTPLEPKERDIVRIACGERAALFGYDLGAKETCEPDEFILARVAVGAVPTRPLVSAAGHELAARVKARLLGNGQEQERLSGAAGHMDYGGK